MVHIVMRYRMRLPFSVLGVSSIPWNRMQPQNGMERMGNVLGMVTGMGMEKKMR